ncbi:membrane protein insertion efficiency factor YidD [Patescibacteria group bacterium]|nr:membrane protein insertion efficiency factor YidD [Patescibacteria group bacterium]MBU1970679.1 membrane protein insertion efficiency factor YidD [Patescibacteria group bacterium]
MKKLTLKLLQFYKNYLSPGRLGLKICRFEPSCSRYTYQAVQKYGVFKGLLLGCRRVLRCNPFNKGGYDPLT